MFKFDHGDGEDRKQQLEALQNFEALQLLEVMYGDHCSSTFTKSDLCKSLLRHAHTLEQSAAVKWALEIQEDKQSRDYAWLIDKMIAQQATSVSLQVKQASQGKGKKESATANFAPGGQVKCQLCDLNHTAKNCPRYEALQQAQAKLTGSKFPGGGKSDKQTRGEAQSKNLTCSGDAQVPTCMYCYGLEKMSVAHNHSTSKCRNRREYAQALVDPDQTEVINQRQADFIKIQRGAMQKGPLDDQPAAKQTRAQSEAHPATRNQNDGHEVCQVCYLAGRSSEHDFMKCPIFR